MIKLLPDVVVTLAEKYSPVACIQASYTYSVCLYMSAKRYLGSYYVFINLPEKQSMHINTHWT